MKRVALIALGVVASVAAQAQLATKQDVTQMAAEKSAPLIDGSALVQLVVALGVVFLLVKFALPKLVAKFTNRVSTDLGGSIKTCETATCGTSTLQVLEVRGRTLLVSVNPNGVNLIADLSTPTTPEQKEEEAKPAFFELLDARKQESVDSLLSKAVVEELPEEKPQPKQDDFEESLRLLTEARARMNARQTETPEAATPRERLRKLTG